MVEFYKKVDNKYCTCYESDAEYVMIPKQEYNGLQNALRIVKDRSLQQIDKSVADANGYRLLRTDKKKYNNKNLKFWLVSKSTPYSIKMPLDVVHELVERDLREYYHYYDWYDYVNRNGSPIITVDQLGYLNKLCNNDYHERYPESTYEDIFQEIVVSGGYCVDEKLVMSFDLNRISINYASGLYEISYWSTVPI